MRLPTRAPTINRACASCHVSCTEWLADLVAIDHSSPEAEEESKQRLQVGRGGGPWCLEKWVPGLPCPEGGWRDQHVTTHHLVANAAHLQTLAAAWRTSGAAPSPASGGAGAGSTADVSALALTSSNKPTCGLGKQVSLLFGRSLRQVRRAWLAG